MLPCVPCRGTEMAAGLLGDPPPFRRVCGIHKRGECSVGVQGAGMPSGRRNRIQRVHHEEDDSSALFPRTALRAFDCKTKLS